MAIPSKHCLVCTYAYNECPWFALCMRVCVRVCVGIKLISNWTQTPGAHVRCEYASFFVLVIGADDDDEMPPPPQPPLPPPSPPSTASSVNWIRSDSFRTAWQRAPNAVECDNYCTAQTVPPPTRTKRQQIGCFQSTGHTHTKTTAKYESAIKSTLAKQSTVFIHVKLLVDYIIVFVRRRRQWRKVFGDLTLDLRVA